jgi:aminopeptidase
MPNIPDQFPEFSLTRLLKTVFQPEGGEKTCVLIDLADPREIKDFAFLSNPELTIQKYAHDIFYKGLNNGAASELGLKGGEIYAYKMTGGSNLDYEDPCFDPSGKELSLEKDIFPNYDIILCVSTFSATAPLTAHAKQYGFRGATLHGLNEVILSSGLCVDYEEVSAEAEKLRLGLTKADWVEIDYITKGEQMTLRLILDGQEAQKSHGLCHGKEPDVANLPAGEVYFVPHQAEGAFPMKYEDGTIGRLDVRDGRVVKVSLIEGSLQTISDHQNKIINDPVTGEIGELGFGTQLLPFSGRDIQDEKVRGTIHVATGRSDHLGGHLKPDMFKHAENATHDDILFAPHKTPEIEVPEVRMQRDGQVSVLIQNYEPAEYMESLLK